jgi:5-formyltetrahydrofolate cyclo-ligase
MISGKGTHFTKQSLRREIKGRLKNLAPEEFLKEGARASSSLLSCPYWPAHRSILVFLSLDLEIDTSPLLKNAFPHQKTIFAPRVEGSRIRFYRVPSPEGPWRHGFFLSGNPPGTEKP